MTFHENYSSLLAQLSSSLIKAGWNRLTTRKKNPLSESEANVETESYCTAIPVSKPKKSGFEKTKSQISDSSPNSLLYRPEGSYSEEEVNARIKEATDNLRQEFIKSTEETLKNIKQQKI
ncbi:13941_t:CDS:2 [Cetraspora pellucida]|uniref:13941_t:CDS:1 n=1 Tax=Cetraspora pellucida TaxID=1433469 RepID=A0ACA9MS07_9GLOM|nr:13941_t:CDS:2 [Cetraspora pellucida]